MSKKVFKVKVTDEEEIEKLTKEFEEEKKRIHKKVYNSVSEERLRSNKIITSYKIKASIEKVFEAVAIKSAQDMHTDLKYEDLEQGCFYRSSGKSSKIPFRITVFEVNKEIEIEFFAKDQHFIKTLRFKKNRNNTKTKITYIDIATGTVSIQGWFEKHIKDVYVKRQIIAFKLQVMNALLDLNIVEKNKVESVKKKMKKLLEYSKNLY